MTDRTHVLFGTIQHWGDMIMILPAAKGFSMNNHLMFGIHQRLSIVPLNDPVRGYHLR